MLGQALEPLLPGAAAHVVAFVLGALFGSFANVCIYRMPPDDEHPRGRSIVLPPSHCPACKTPIRWYDNLPLVSYAFLRGRCRACAARFSPRYLLVEAATALLFVAVYHLAVVLIGSNDPVPLRLARFGVMAAFVFVLVVITFIDLDHRLILDRITYPAIPLFYGLGLCLPDRRWYEGLIGAAVGYGVVRLISDGYYFLTRRHGMGYGDGKLLAIVGAWLGWQGVVVALFLGSLIGSVISIGYLGLARLLGRDAAAAPGSEVAAAGEPDEALAPDDPVEASDSIRHVEVPFGPFLAAGALAYLFLQPWLRVSFSILYS